MKRTFLFLLTIMSCSVSFAQTDAIQRDTLFEKTVEGLVRFYYDDHYYLVDKDCEFKSIERLSQFIVSKNAFHGEFKDFDRNGTLILTGYHNQGKKEGLFKAYHPNKTLKWEVMFTGNIPTGDWKYYYPDGKPMLTVNFTEGSGKIVSFWDRLGRQQVVEGQGSYDFKMPFEYYNEYGYPFFERKGKIRNGLPYGYWTTNMVDEKNRKALFTEEVYNKNGVLTEGYNLFLDSEYRTPLTIIPSQSFLLGEKLLFKQCNFDDYSGFNTYLSEKMNAAFTANADLQHTEDKFTYRVSIDKNGEPETLTLSEPLKTEVLNRYLERVAKNIPFYFPSLDETGQAVEDTLTISGKLSVNEAGEFNFHSLKIEREKQQ